MHRINLTSNTYVTNFLALLPSLIVLIAIFYVVYRWALYFFLPLFMVIALLPILLGLGCVLLFLCWFKGRKWCLITSLSGACFLSAMLWAAGWYAPIYANQHAEGVAARFIEETAIQVAIKEQTIELVSMRNDVAPPRYIQTIYVFREPVDSVIDKLRSKFRRNAFWVLLDKGDVLPSYWIKERTWLQYDIKVFGAFCSENGWRNQDGQLVYGTFDNTVVIDEQNNLIVTMFLDGRQECLLQAGK